VSRPIPRLEVEILGGPTVRAEEGVVHLSPHQAAFLTLVYAEEPVSRPSIARILWRADATPPVRHRIRQLRHALNRRVGHTVIAADGDRLTVPAGVSSDLVLFRTELEEGRLLDAATRLAAGFAPCPFPGVSAEFDDWRQAFDKELRRGLKRRADRRWDEATRAGKRSSGRDAAEASYLLQPEEASVVARVIEARASASRVRAAEVAYGEYISRIGVRATPDDHVEDVISRVRALHDEASEGVTPTQLPFVGREAVLAQLRPTVDGIRDGTFGFAVITGEAGIGKTRVLSEVRREAHLNGVRCLSAQSVELESNISLNPILDALGSIEVEPHLRALGEPWRTVVGAMLPSGYLDEPVGVPPPIEERSLSRRLLDGFSLLLERLAAEEPTILFLDDLQWADATTVAVIQFMQRRWGESPFGVVATVRRDLVREKSPLAIYLAEDCKLAVNQVDLDELTEVEARQLIRSFADARLNDEVTQKLFALAGHHPLYLTELARDFMAGRLLLPESPADEINIPISLRQILQARSEGLSETATRLAAILAVGSKHMRLSDLARILTLSLDTTADAAEELAASGLASLERDRVWITHDLFRSAICADLSEARRAVLHRQLADHLLSTGDDVFGELAIHFERAGETACAAEYGWRAAEHSLEGGAVAEAAQLFELVTRNESDEGRRAQATALYATSLYLNRDISRANPALELASSRLVAAGMPDQARRMDIRRVEGLAEASDTSVQVLVERLNSIKDQARGGDDWESVAMALDVELRLIHLDEKLERAGGLLSQFHEVVEKGSQGAQALAHLGLAVGLLLVDPEAALASGVAAVSLAEESARDLRLKALNRLLITLVQQGRVHRPEFEAYLGEAEMLAGKSGDLLQRFVLEANLGVSHLDAGDLDRAEARFARAGQLLGSAEMSFSRVNLACNLGELHLARADYLAAEESFNEILSLGDTPQFARDVATAGLGLCSLETGRIREAHRLEASLGPPPAIWYYDPTVLLSFRSKLLERQGHPQDAIRILREGADQLRDRLVVAWIKLQLVQARILIKTRDPRASSVIEEGFGVASQLGLAHRTAEFVWLRDRTS